MKHNPTRNLKRRHLLMAAAALTAAGWSGLPLRTLAAQRDVRYLPGSEPFDYRWLKNFARQLSARAYVPAPDALPDAVKALDWYRYAAIRFRDEHALWGASPPGSPFRVKFFHLGHLFRAPVRIYELDGSRARELAYDPAMFDYGDSGLAAAELPADLGFAGFRIHAKPEWDRDATSFLGASYFRAIGDRFQFGMSARGLMIDGGLPRTEEFPRFSRFWLERPAANSDTLTLYALLESPSISGAYRFVIRYAGKRQLMDIDAALYPRKSVERLGIAPLTSMFQYGENDRRAAGDWRPEIHDSDGLAMQRGNGEWLWRPLTNPPRLHVSDFVDENPRGFGLLQRDRNFDHYQDDSMFYESRPSVWVETKGDWGKGAVQLIELTAPDETFDNIVACWSPATPARPGQEMLYSYRLHWSGAPDVQTPLARVVSTYTGPGGLIGQNIVSKRREFFSWRFVVDFAGGGLPNRHANGIHPIIDASRGNIDLVSLHWVEATNRWRAQFDLRPDGSDAPTELRLVLQNDQGKPLSETWLYQWSPLPRS